MLQAKSAAASTDSTYLEAYFGHPKPDFACPRCERALGLLAYSVPHMLGDSRGQLTLAFPALILT